MKIAYIGTPALSAGLLQKIIDNKNNLDIEISVVITQPDQPVGRKKTITPTPIKGLALQNNLLISYDLEVLKDIQVDLALLFAFGKIIPQNILDLPSRGFWNIHPSLLPAYRGASPIVFPMLLGESESGVSLMQMDSDLDHGPIIEQIPFHITLETMRAEIEREIIDMSYSLVAKTIQKIHQGENVAVAQQNHSLATFTRPLEKNDGYIKKEFFLNAINGEKIPKEELPQLIQEFYTTNKIDHSESFYNASTVLWNMYRALFGWPGVWTTFSYDSELKRLKILEVKLKDNKIVPITVQVEGKKPVSFETFIQAYKLT